MKKQKIKIDPKEFTLLDLKEHLSKPTTNALTRTINALLNAKLNTLNSMFKLPLEKIFGYRNTGPKGVLAILNYLHDNFEFDIVKERDILFYTTVKILSKHKKELLAIQDLFLKIRGHKGGFDEAQKQIMRKRLLEIELKIAGYYKIIEDLNEKCRLLEIIIKT